MTLTDAQIAANFSQWPPLCATCIENKVPPRQS
jgi:hypothetical protein